jgi:DNA-binding MarR family transcriptional regulator
MQRNRDIGKLQLSILEYLALNPNSLIQPTKRALKKDYRNVNMSFHTLEQKGFVEKGSKVQSEKKAEYDGYKLTRKGEAYVLAFGSETMLLKALKTEENLPSYKDFQQIINLLERKTAIKVLRLTGKLSLSSEKTEPHALMTQLFLSGLVDFSEGERKSLWEVAKKVESTRRVLLKAADLIEKELRSEEAKGE